MRRVPRRSRLLSAALLGGALISASGSASGQAPTVDTKVECINASEQGQKLRSERKLHDARTQFFLCARTSCPALLRRDCTEWVERVNSDIPTVVIRARDPAGNDIVDARVSIDHSPTFEPVDGRKVSVDPGPHLFHIEGRGDHAERTVVLAEGDRRDVLVTLGGAGAVQAPPPPTRDAGVQRSTSAGPPTLSLILGGVGVLGLASFVYFGASGTSDADALRDGCSRTATCSRGDVDSVESKYLIADISLGVAIAALAGAVVVWVTRPSAPAAVAQPVSAQSR